MQQGAHARGVVVVVPTVTLTESHDAEDLMEQMEAKLGPFIDGFTGTVAQRPSADFLVEFAPGFYLGTEVRGDLLRPGVSKGTHGYLPSRPELHAAFFIRGPNIDPGRDLGIIDMRQIAPTLAGILGVRLPHKTGPALQLSQLPSRPASSPAR